MFHDILLGMDTVSTTSNDRRGFTLIELLVVIAIIGILSSVVLASLNSARNKGADAATKSTLDNMRAQASLFYDTGYTYTGLCAEPTIAAAMLSTASSSAAVNVKNQNTDVGDTSSVTCHALGEGWAIEAPLKAAGANAMFCVDATATSVTIGGSTLGNGIISCN